MGDISVSLHPFCPDYFPEEPFKLPVNFFYPLGSLTRRVAFRSQSHFLLYFHYFPLAVGMKDFCSLSLSTLPNTFPIKVPCLTAAQYNPYGCNVLRNLSISGVFYILSVICGTWPQGCVGPVCFEGELRFCWSQQRLNFLEISSKTWKCLSA